MWVVCGLGAFVGFLIALVLGFLFPGIGHLIGGLIGGFVAGIIARGVMLRGALAGFFAGIFGGIIVAILAILGLAVVGGVAWWNSGRTIRRLGEFGNRSCSNYSCYLWSYCINDWRTHWWIACEVETSQ